MEEIEEKNISEKKIELKTTIDLGKATIVVFMLSAAMCGILGFYLGTQYVSTQCNDYYNEFLNTHCCIEGRCTGSNIDLTDFSYINVRLQNESGSK